KSFMSWQDDIGTLINELGLKDPVALGFSQGAPFAYALGARGLVSKVVIVSGQDDFSDPAMRELLPPHSAGFVSMIRSGDKKFLAEFSESVDAQGFYKLIESFSSEKDRELYCSEPFKTSYLNCLKEGFAQGPQGYIQDLLLTLNDWPFTLQ